MINFLKNKRPERFPKPFRSNSEIIKWFEDLDNFIACHEEKNDFNKIKNFIIE